MFDFEQRMMLDRVRSERETFFPYFGAADFSVDDPFLKELTEELEALQSLIEVRKRKR